MRLFTGPSAAPSGLKPCCFCMSSGISSRRSASICHCGEPVQMASVPHSTWAAPRPRTSMPIIAADTCGSAIVVCANSWPTSAVDIAHAVLGRDLGEIGHPLDAPRLFELRPGILHLAAAREPVAAVIDDEVDLRPVLGGAAHVAHVGVREQVRELRLHRRREESLVNADLVLARLEQLLVERVDE